MVKYDKFLAVFLLLLSGCYYILIKGLPEKAASYPTFVLGLMLIFIFLQIGEGILKKEKNSENIFKHIELKQFSFIIVSAFIYILLMGILGFFVSTFLYLNLTMRGLKITLKKSLPVSLLFCFLIHGIFVVFLKVPVPKGFLI